MNETALIGEEAICQLVVKAIDRISLSYADMAGRKRFMQPAINLGVALEVIMEIADHANCREKVRSGVSDVSRRVVFSENPPSGKATKYPWHELAEIGGRFLVTGTGEELAKNQKSIIAGAYARFGSASVRTKRTRMGLWVERIA